MSVFKDITNEFNQNDIDVSSYSPVALAYLGDSVYENVLRSIMLAHGNQKVAKLHDSVTKYSMASAQARLIDILMPILTEEEETMYKRGRNASKHSAAKHQTIADYKKSTGFETMIGYLYIKGEDKRILELIKYGLKELN